ncbi:aminoglycoside 3'-phosphotransferase [Salinibacterium sp. ZJ70]|uniref:aminoglycoside 3'-phosphotransferase n=1 Tax=Salinibacterium sp. ZJ70 TaxID=2708084 RepID=UPI001420AD1C|nr:aminoglycoside 3'-phosphotransferase [Salinibacterium sp. ZJ70]
MAPASAPDGHVELPEAVRTRSPRAQAVWRNELGGVTFRDADRYLKWNPQSTGISLADEVARMRWAASFHPVPEVVEFAPAAQGELLVTRALPGEGAVTPRWLAEPRIAVRAIGEGLRALHEGIPRDDCPFDWSVEARLARLSDAERAALGDVPPVDVLVVCHGDACAPNTVIADDGGWAGHVDLGALGLADRWADLAVASMSLDWNYGPGWQDELFAAYGVRPDAERIRFYRGLWDAN